MIETDRLVLREYIRDDWKSVHSYASKIEVVRYMDFGPNTEQDTKDFVNAVITAQNQEARTAYEFAMTLKHSGRLIGGCGLGLERHDQASLGYCLHPEFWGQGFATEADMALCEFGFPELHLHRILATCRPENMASARVMEKLGMKPEGLLREHLFVRGQWRDSCLYSILHHEFGTISKEGGQATQ